MDFHLLNMRFVFSINLFPIVITVFGLMSLPKSVNQSVIVPILELIVHSTLLLEQKKIN